MPAFKFDSTSVFLTYPHTALEHQEVFDALNTVRELAWARICTEKHADGEPHIHVVGAFTRRFQTRNQNAFDIAGRHPNIQRIRSIPKALEYVTKDGEFTDFGTVPVAGRRTASEIYQLALTASEEEFWVAAAEARIGYQYADRFRRMASNTNTIGDDYEGDITRERLDVCIQTVAEGRSTVIIGPSGIGKTSWAKRVAPKPCLWVRHLDVLREFRAGYHKAIIFDDMSFSHMPRTSQIHLADYHDAAHVHCRYGHATIPAGVTKIFTANENPFTYDPAIERRVHAIVFTD